jgi:hypothetical protein
VSDGTDNRRDARERPPDPAGTRPRHDPRELLPASREPLLTADVEGSVVEEAPPTAADALLPARPDAAGPPALASADAAAPHAPRFQFLTGALLAIGVTAVLVMAAIALAPARQRQAGPAWSPWRPTAGHGDGAKQIAEYVGSRYKLTNGRQLVAVTGGPLEVAGLPLTVALREAPNQGGQIELIDGNGVLYRLCGLGDKCSIPFGKPSRERHLLLRREALELALYSFRYLKGVDDVAVFMPPPPGQDPSQALFFRKSELAAQLDRPLDATLPSPVPSLKTVAASPNVGFVNRLTTSTLFKFSLTQANQDDRAFLVLDPYVTSAR